MAQTTTMTIRLDKKMQKQLEEIAIYEKRSKSYMAAEAVGHYLAMRELQIKGIEQAMASAEAGQGVPHFRVKAWAESLGTANELPIPIK